MFSSDCTYYLSRYTLYCCNLTCDINNNFASKIDALIKKCITYLHNNNIRKSIRYMIAKTLGVHHRKVSNIGVWGETGRYPLIYQSIKLALKYYRRVTELDHNSFAYAAGCALRTEGS